MSDAKKQSSLMATLALCAVFVALVSFFLPFVSISFFGTYSYSAIELIEEIIDYPEFPDVGVLISLICTVLAIVFSLLALKKRGMEVGTIITSAIGMILMIVAMTSDIGLGQRAIDYAAVGFYLYEMASLAAIVLSVSARYISKHEEPSAVGEIPTPAPKPTPKPVPPAPESTSTNKAVCPKCKAVQEKGAVFCRFCGTPINNSKPIPPKPTPMPNPTPNPSPTPAPAPKPAPKTKDGKVVCPHCGARHVMGTTSCKYCGTTISGTHGPQANPVAVEEPISTPVCKPTTTGKTERKAVCPHCGARQGEDAINCKYCGTAMK